MTTDKGNSREPTSDLQVRLNVLNELRVAFRAAIRLCDDAEERLRSARDSATRDRIGAEIEGFIRRLSLGSMALGSVGQRSDTRDVTKGKTP